MQTDSELIDEEDFMKYLQQIFQLCIKNQIYATEFEVAFLMSTLYFREKRCDAIVLEVSQFQQSILVVLRTYLVTRWVWAEKAMLPMS
jgi:hypothetical protein